MWSVVTQFWIHQDFLKCYFIYVILYKNPKKNKKKFKNSKIYFSRVNRIFPSKPSLPGQYGSNHVDQGKKMSFGPFRVKTVIFDQNQVHRVNTTQSMLTRIKMSFMPFWVKTVIFLVKTRSTGFISFEGFFMFQHNFR